MANVLNPNFDYTYDGTLSTQFFYDPIVQYPDLRSVFTVRRVRYKEQLPIVAALGKVLKGAQGCGDLSTTGNAVNITNRTIETLPGEFYLEQCADTFEQTILDEAQRTGEAWYDMRGTPIGNAVQRQIVESVAQDVFRVMSFGDTTSPAGDPAYYGWADGLWTRIIDGTSSYAVTGVNTGITTLNQSDGTRALDYLRSLYEGADILLKQIDASRKRFFVTGNVYENLMTTYEDKALDGGGLTARVENGVTTLMFRGIPVVPVYAWDNWIAADNLGNNTRILYTTPENHVVGLLREADQGNVRQWFDQNTNKVKFFGRMHVGYNWIHDELQAVSYGNV